MVVQAAALVASGHCRHVLAVAGDNRVSGMNRDRAVAALADFGHPEFEQPFGLAIYAAYALVAQRYMHEFGTTPEELAAIAVTHRRHASRHPKAHKRDPITVEDVLRSRVIASPLHLLDCCLVSDGGAAVIVSAPEAAADCARTPVRILGAGQGHTHEHIEDGLRAKTRNSRAPHMMDGQDALTQGSAESSLESVEEPRPTGVVRNQPRLPVNHSKGLLRQSRPFRLHPTVMRLCCAAGVVPPDREASSYPLVSQPPPQARRAHRGRVASRVDPRD